MTRIQALMKYETAGDPMTGLKWTRKTTEKIAKELCSLGIRVGARKVADLLYQMRFSLRVNHKKRSNGSPRERDAQFTQIANLRERFAANNNPLISVDTKKKEMVGNFRNGGRTWQQEPIAVNDHDFRSLAIGMAVPQGIYDPVANRGTVFVGTSYNTPAFATECIERWWRQEGKKRYPHATELAILADGGGSNGHKCRAWKHGLYEQLCRRHGLTVTVAHYPPGASKWNPIEHRLFSEISKNWAGRPLDSYETALKYIRTTRTSTGLRVRAHLFRKTFNKGLSISDAQMHALPLQRAVSLPKWNYIIRPAENGK